MLADYSNDIAWGLATAPGSNRDSRRALSLARRAVELDSGQVHYVTTLGLAQFRVGQHAEAIATLEKNPAAGKGVTDAFDLLFLAMARHKLGQIARAQHDFDRAVLWRRDHPDLSAPYPTELDAFQAEAQALLGGRALELPADVFARKPPSQP